MRAHASLWAGNVAARANYSGHSWPQKPSVATQVLHCHDLIIDHMLPKAEAAWIVYPSGNIRSQAGPRTSLWCVSYTHRTMHHCNCNCYCVLCTTHQWVLLMWCVTDGYSDTCTIQSLVYCNTKAFRWRIFLLWPSVHRCSTRQSFMLHICILVLSKAPNYLSLFVGTSAKAAGTVKWHSWLCGVCC